MSSLETTFPGQGTTIFNLLVANGYIDANGNRLLTLPISRENWLVYIDNILLDDLDLDLKSIEINHNVDEKSTAEFVLARRHDQFNTTLAGVTSTITGQNNVKVYIGTNLEFNGKVAQIDCVYDQSTEKVKVTAWMDQPEPNYAPVLLPLPGLTEQRNLYHIIIQNPKIYNPYIDPLATDPDTFLGIKVKLGKRITESVIQARSFGDTTSLAEDILDDTFKPLQNYTYFWLVDVRPVEPPQVTVIDTSGAVTTRSNTSNFYDALVSGLFVEDHSSITNFINQQRVLFQDFTVSQQKTFQSRFDKSYTAEDFAGHTISILRYIGTSLSTISSNLWDLRGAAWWNQRQRENIEYKLGEGSITVAIIEEELIGLGTAIFNALVSAQYIDGAGLIQEKFKNCQAVDDFEIGYGDGTSQIVYNLLEDQLGYTVGSAPFKEVSCRNGVYVPIEIWVDKADGFYKETNKAYNFTEFAKKVAELEYKKLSNINSSTAITSVDLDLTIDAYYFYGLKLLNRVNISNTTEANIFNNNNGFPTSIKGISLKSETMRVSIVTDNKKSTAELEEIDGQFPNEDAEEFNTRATSIKVFDKYDLQRLEFLE